MAHAAVVTLIQLLEHMDQHQMLLNKEQIQSLQGKLKYLLAFLEISQQNQDIFVRDSEMKIGDAAHKIQDIIESYISKHFLQENEEGRETMWKIFAQDLELVTLEIDFITKQVTKLMDLWKTEGQHQIETPTIADCGIHILFRSSASTTSPASKDVEYEHPRGMSSTAGPRQQPRSTSVRRIMERYAPTRRSSSRDENTMIGFDEDLMQLKDLLTSCKQSKLQIIPIVGMGGIGKTTLAKNLFNDDYIDYYFDTRAWVTISQQYQTREILLGLLESMRKPTVNLFRESVNYLSECLYKSLKGRRYLIIMDDMWTTEVMDEIQRLFPDDHSGSRIVVTTRLSHLISCANSYQPHQHHMHFLGEQESWKLLCRKVFVDKCCPPELEEAGKKIAQSCKGLPLAIVVISGLLTKFERTKHRWEDVAKNVTSIIMVNDVQCSQILSLSYDNLPHHLKACLLYMGLFPEDHKVPASKLIKLWVAEGFLQPLHSTEEVAEEHLKDLISRNLILLDERSSDGKIKTCSIHDLVRDICVRKAKEEKFHLAKHIDMLVHSFRVGSPRRLTIIGSFCTNNAITPNFQMPGRMLSHVRSLFCSNLPWIIRLLDDSLDCKLLRVLDLGEVNLCVFPTELLRLVHLRYLSFSCKGNVHIPKLLPEYLWNLQTLIVYQEKDDGGIWGTRVFWRMPQLRHLRFEKCYLDFPYLELLANKNLVLENLQTLAMLSSYSCTKKLFKRVPNLKKLGIRVERSHVGAAFSLGNLVNLPQLEKLKCIVDYGASVSIPTNYTLPKNLKKLTLKRTRIPWKEMSTIGSLPNLQVLKLIKNAFQGKEWKPIDGQFGKLKYLLIDGATTLQCWGAESNHFPILEHLILWDCLKLEEIPYGFGDIPTLTLVELDDASPSLVTSAKEMEEEQHDMGNEAFQVRVLNNSEIVRRQKKVEREEMHKEMRQRFHSNAGDRTQETKTDAWERTQETKTYREMQGIYNDIVRVHIQRMNAMHQ